MRAIAFLCYLATSDTNALLAGQQLSVVISLAATRNLMRVWRCCAVETRNSAGEEESLKKEIYRFRLAKEAFLS